MNSQDSDRLRPSSVRKRDAMLEAAQRRFLLAGFDRASMDEIAADAGVAKQTIYSRFGSKDDLFLAVVEQATTRAFHAVDIVAGKETIVDQWLTACAQRLMAAVLDDELIRLRKLVIAESERFPDLAAAFWSGGAERTIAAIAARIEDFQQSGVLRAGDATTIAEHFNWLVLGTEINEAMFRTPQSPPDSAAAVEAFRRAYRT